MLAHRIPFPPDRGDKIRSFHLLQRLCRVARVHVATFADDAADAAHAAELRDALESGLGSVTTIVRTRSRGASVFASFASGRSASMEAFASPAMRDTVGEILRRNPIASIFVFSGQMSQYVPETLGRIRFAMDFVDVDSAKLESYADQGHAPLRWLYRREATRLAAEEAGIAARADVSLFVTEAEARLFHERSGVRAPNVRALENGVDLAFFDPEPVVPEPTAGAPLLVFSGQMDYAPNVQAVTHFAQAILPRIRESRPGARFAIVGRNPAPAVQALKALPGVQVVGGIPDMRPWLAAAHVVVAPLQVARGVQNKVLEAMAMARPVVASPQAFEGIDAEPGRDLLVADGAEATAAAVLRLAADGKAAGRMGAAARAGMCEPYGWDRQFAAGQPGVRMSVAATARREVAEPATGWRRHLTALAIAVGAVLMLLAGDAAHIATIWWRSSTFNHCLLIVPIIAWLVWQRAPALAGLTPLVWPAGLALVGAGSLAWMLGDAAGVSLFRHAGLVVMLQGLAVTLLGRDVARALAFPLFYALFLIPAGEELVPLLQVVTAHLSMALLGLVGIPAHMEGVFITTPGGYFEVAEACYGVKFLVAMLALGALVAHVGFRSWPRRLAFVATALIVPVLANGVRAFATIYVAAETSNAAASGFDDVVYGWFFFGIAIVMGLAWRFFDRAANEVAAVRAPVAAAPAGTSSPLMLGLAVTLVAAPIAWSASASAGARHVRLPALAAPVVPGWTPVARSSGVPWTTRFAGADRLLVQRYRDAQGGEVDLAVAAFAWQGEGRELVGFGQGAVAPDGGWSWSQGGSPPAGGRADRIVADGVMREVLSFYRVGGVTTGSDAAVKLETLKARLLGRSQTAVAVLVSSQAVRGEAPPRVAIHAFLDALGPVFGLAERAVGA